MIGNHSATKPERASRIRLPYVERLGDAYKLSDYNGYIVPRPIGGVKEGSRTTDLKIEDYSRPNARLNRFGCPMSANFGKETKRIQ